MAGHREDFAGARIDRDHGPSLVAQGLFRHLLQIQINREDYACTGFFGRLRQHAQAPSDRVHFDFLVAADTAQKIVPAPLQAELSDLIPHVVVGDFPEFLLVDFADVSQQMGSKRAIEVATARRDLDADSGQIELMGFEGHHLIPGQPLLDRDRIERRPPVVLGLGNFFLGVVIAQIALEVAHRGRKVLRVLRNHDRVKRRTGIHQHAMAPIEDESA